MSLVDDGRPIDSNVPMYLVGADHPNKDAARAVLERLISESERLVTDVAVVQEILHRYSAIRRRDAMHVAVIERMGVTRILSFDRGFDSVEGLERITG